MSVEKPKYRVYIRPHPRIPKSTQIKLATEAGFAHHHYVDGDNIERADFVRALRKEEAAVVTHLFLLASPKLEPGFDPYRDLLQTVATCERRAKYLLELSSGRRLDRKQDRGEALADAFMEIQTGGRAAAARRNGKRSAGRPKTDFGDEENLQKIKDATERVWFDRRYTWAQAAKRLPKGVSTNRAFLWFGPRNKKTDD